MASKQKGSESDASLREECIRFYNREAELLDDRALEDWLELLTEDVSYKVPLRLTREAGSGKPEFSEDSYHFDENLTTLQARVERFDKEYAWAENPPSRTRRFVTNVRAEENDGNEIAAKSNLLVRRLQGDHSRYDLISGQREDILRFVDGELKLAERVVYLDETVVGTKNFSIFL